MRGGAAVLVGRGGERARRLRVRDAAGGEPRRRRRRREAREPGGGERPGRSRVVM